MIFSLRNLLERPFAIRRSFWCFVMTMLAREALGRPRLHLLVFLELSIADETAVLTLGDVRTGEEKGSCVGEHLEEDSPDSQHTADILRIQTLHVSLDFAPRSAK